MKKNLEQRATIKFGCKERFTAAKMWEMFVKALGDSSVSYTTVFQWHSQFEVGEESIEDVKWSGRLATTKTLLGWQLF